MNVRRMQSKVFAAIALCSDPWMLIIRVSLVRVISLVAFRLIIHVAQLSITVCKGQSTICGLYDWSVWRACTSIQETGCIRDGRDRSLLNLSGIAKRQSTFLPHRGGCVDAWIAETEIRPRNFSAAVAATLPGCSFVS